MCIRDRNEYAINLYRKLGFEEYGKFPNNMRYSDADVYKRQELRKLTELQQKILLTRLAGQRSSLNGKQMKDCLLYTSYKGNRGMQKAVPLDGWILVEGRW